MYPFARLTLQALRWRNQPLDPWGTHVSHHIVMPWDLDFMGELNNGLTLTFYDMGRIPFVLRIGAWKTFQKNGLSLTIAGSAVRYRRRLTLFEKFEQRTRVAGWDARFLYFDQSFWIDPDTCAGQGVFRAAVVRNRKMVNMETEVIPLLDRPELHDNRPHLPEWMVQWAAAESARPWPPERA
ncbi:acyl-CoA thioesterase [Pseudooceanicola sp.]|uniref:acyl-CoA thioesterase n=1 Tax=Pseudooceanicola sp. TaxID=1914328 RepID=UPI00261B7D15|nr:acyl-CoA thioesterase [Pseudooceanicola sp.]MDF1856348.1 acyl-CoA thioesterase [Pseudooceanicola sp.]